MVEEEGSAWERRSIQVSVPDGGTLRDDGVQPNGGALTADDGVLQADDELHGRCYDGEQVVNTSHDRNRDVTDDRPYYDPEPLLKLYP